MVKKTDEQKALEKYNANLSAEVEKTIQELTQSHPGRAFLWWLLQLGRVNIQPFSSSPEKTAFNCGELNVGNQILAKIIEVTPEGYLTMMKEKQNERNTLNTDSVAGTRSVPGAYDDAAAEPEPPAESDNPGAT